MNLVRHILTLPLLASLLASSACTGGDDPTAAQEAPVVEQIRSVERRPDGRFDVTCDDGRIEVVTADQIRRDEVCGTSGGSDNALGRFSCDNFGELRASVVSASGAERTASVDVGDRDRCNAFAGGLNETRADIHRTMLVGACDRFGTMKRLVVTPSGEILPLPDHDFGDRTECDANAKQLNGRVGLVTGPASVGHYSCDRFGTLRISLVSASGAERTATVDPGDRARCQRAATTLNQTRSDVRRTMMLGACDRFGTLERFSVTARGELQRLSSEDISDGARCQAQQDLLNR